jgi:hypothetical protein
MKKIDPIVVFNFRIYEGHVEQPRIPGFKATREAITRLFEGELMEGTAEHVHPDRLDEHGCLRRRPTGWVTLQ